MAQTTNKQLPGSYLIWGAVLLIAILVLIYAAQRENHESRMERAGAELSEGVNDAVDELDGDRNIGERAGEAVEDAGRKIEDAAD